MNKIVVLIGSRQKNGNTVTFARSILETLPRENFKIEYIFPQDFEISPCIGCKSCFKKIKCTMRDELPMLQEKILVADVFVIASPVYLHNITADLQLILEKSSWWAHTLRLQGKPTVILSTCQSNGHRKVIEPLSKIMTCMGGNVIATANASELPNQLNNSAWVKTISLEISKRILKFSALPLQSNEFLEESFINLKKNMLFVNEKLQKMNLKNEEVEYWKNTGLIECNTYGEYLLLVEENRKESE
jgi:Multimeric flavodoxin WrbA